MVNDAVTGRKMKVHEPSVRKMSIYLSALHA